MAFQEVFTRVVLDLPEDLGGRHMKNLALGKLMKCSESHCPHLDNNNHELDTNGQVFLES